jgi:hypothetical protein
MVYLALVPAVAFILVGLPYVVILALSFSGMAITYLGAEIRKYPSMSRREKIVTVLAWPCVATLILFSHISYAAGFVFGWLRRS